MENKSLFELLAEAQSHSMKNFVDTSKKLQETFTKKESLEKTSDVMKEWFANQKTIVEHAMADAKLDKLPETYKNFADKQTKAFKEFSESVQAKLKSQDWAGVQQQMMAESKKMYDQWAEYMKTMQESAPIIAPMPNFNNFNFASNDWSSFMDAAKTYTKMYEVWKPMADQMKGNWDKMSQGKWDKDMFGKMVNMDEYKEVMEGMMKMSPFTSNEEVTAFMKKMTEGLGGQYKEWQSKMTEMAEKMKAQFAENPMLQPEAAREMMKQMEKMYEPWMKLMPAGKDKDRLDAWVKLNEKYTQYSQKSAEMQQLLAAAGQKALEQMMEELAAEAKKTEVGKVPQLSQYNEFYNKWLGMTESAMQQTFGSNEYSKLQGELLKLGMEIKKMLESQLEQQLSLYPIMGRSEGNDLVHELHELKNRVRTLERDLGETGDAEKTVKKTTTTRTTKE